jgi:hypothetical protein
MYDIIGDIHGHAAALKELLHKMDYKEKGGIWQHSRRKIIFVGDYIDRGPAIRETLHIVRSMQENGCAIALMGNHEFNALAYDYQLPDGSYLRCHNAKHNRQHEQTLLQFKNYEQEWRSYLDWFYNLQLFLDLPELRAVHACWDEAHITWLRNNGYEKLKEDLLISSHQKDSYPNKVIEEVLKGKEYNIPEEYAWVDKDGHIRCNNRLKWWVNPSACSYGQFLFNCPEALKHKMLEEQVEVEIYPAEAKPVFFGHYWLEDPYPVVQAANVVCLDYSIAKGGNLVAYRWYGERRLDNRHFVSVGWKEPTL